MAWTVDSQSVSGNLFYLRAQSGPVRHHLSVGKYLYPWAGPADDILRPDETKHYNTDTAHENLVLSSVSYTRDKVHLLIVSLIEEMDIKKSVLILVFSSYLILSVFCLIRNIHYRVQL